MKNPFKHRRSILVIAIGLCLFFSLSSCIADRSLPAKPVYTLNILHINDTHSHIDPEEWTVKIDGRDTKVLLGGFARLIRAIEEERGRRVNTLLLHAGDAFQGTLYFTHYEGAADGDFLNLMGIDTMVTGNHEYDKGPAFLGRFIDAMPFPVLSANTHAGSASGLKGKILPYVIKETGGEKIGIIGLTTTETRHSSSPGAQVTFSDPIAAAGQYCRDLAARGIHKIIVLSHLGFDMDRKLARTVGGIDIIVGGHSHTPLGNFRRFGMNAMSPYPWIEKGPDGRDVPIVSAWEWGKILGRITLSFDERGRIVAYEGAPILIVGRPFKQRWKNTNGDGAVDADDSYTEVTPEEAPARYAGILRFIEQDGEARVYEDHGEGKRLRDHYAEGLETLRKTVVATALENLRGPGNDAGAGPLVADSFLWKTVSTGAVVAIENVRALRSELTKGPVTAGQIYELLPFRNTLVILDLRADELRQALEEAVDHSHKKMGYGAGKYIYVSGIRFRVDLSQPMGERISRMEVEIDGTYEPLAQGRIYKVITNSFLAAGGDNFQTFKRASSKYDTGYIDADVFLEYVKERKTLTNPIENRVIVEDRR
jgi:5'-nucleotidase